MRQEARQGASSPKMSSGMSQTHATRVCAQLNKELVGATHIPTSGPGLNYKDKGVTRRRLPHFRYYRAEDRVVAVNRTKGKESPTTTNSGAISRNVLIHLQKVEQEMEVVDIWCELKYKKVTLWQEQPYQHDNISTQVLAYS